MALDLFQRPDFEAFVLDLPAATLVHQWGNAAVAKVGGKMFAIQSRWERSLGWQVNFKCSDMSFRLLPELNGVTPAKYLARAKWVSVSAQSDLTPEELEAYLVESHRLIGSRLPRRIRTELGLTSDVYAGTGG